MTDAAERAGRRMKIFISYGHPEMDLCLRIHDWLEANGYEPWSDRGLRATDEWRSALRRRLRDVDCVILCVSEHSMRPDSPCLDEISIASEMNIAASIRGDNIFPVLLSREKIHIPAWAHYRQDFEMCDYDRQGDMGSPAFRAWLDGKMRALMKSIEGSGILEFHDKLRQIRDRLDVRLGADKRNGLLDAPFVGREWLTKEIDAWLDDPHGGPLCVLYGESGIGKSMFAAHYGQDNPRVAASLFLDRTESRLHDARAVIPALAFLMASRIPFFRDALLGNLEGLDVAQLSERGLFRKLIEEPAQCVRGSLSAMCIVIDALDEAGSKGTNALALWLCQCREWLPPWLRILVTSRKCDEVTEALRGALSLTLGGEQDDNRRDIRNYFEAQLGERFENKPVDREKYLNMLVEQADGNFRHALSMASDLLSGRKDLRGAAKLPRDRASEYFKKFSALFPDPEDYEDRYYLPMGMILAAPDSLPREELKRAMNWMDREQNRFLRCVRELLRFGRDDFGRETVRFASQSLREWLNADFQIHRYAVSADDAIYAMAEAFYAYFEIAREAVPICAFDAETAGDVRGEDLAEYLESFLPGEVANEIPAQPAPPDIFEGDAAVAFDVDAEDFAAYADYSYGREANSPAEAIEAQQDFTPYEATHLIPFLEWVARKSIGGAERTRESRRRLREAESSSFLLDRLLRAGNYCAERGRLDGALACYEQGMWIARARCELAENDPDAARRELYALCAKIAEIERRLGRPEDAGRHCNQAFTLHRQLRREPASPEYRCERGGLCRLAADIWLARGGLRRGVEVVRTGARAPGGGGAGSPPRPDRPGHHAGRPASPAEPAPGGAAGLRPARARSRAGAVRPHLPRRPTEAARSLPRRARPVTRIHSRFHRGGSTWARKRNTA